MKAVNLGSGPYHFKSILSCRIEKTVNSHFRAEVSGYTADSVEEALRISEQKEPFVIYAEEEGEKRSAQSLIPAFWTGNAIPGPSRIRTGHTAISSAPLPEKRRRR